LKRFASLLNAFIAGMGSVLDIGGTSAPPRYRARRRDPADDAKNLERDRAAVMGDLKRATRRVLGRPS